MSAFAIALVKIKNLEKMQEYAKMAEPTLSIYGGKVTTRGKVSAALVGKANIDMVAVMEFPGKEKLDAWYNSIEYQNTIETRNQGADVTILVL